MLRPTATPFPLGFAGLAVGTLLMSGLELHWIPASGRQMTAILILAFAPTLQIIASLFAFWARDAVAATSFGVQSASWLGIGLALLLAKGTAHGQNPELALLLFVASSVLLLSASTAARSKLVPALAIGLAGARFGLTGLYEITSASGWNYVAAWTGVGLCAVAIYAAFSLEVEDVLGHAVLPTLRHGSGKQVLDPELDQQVGGIASEAGVRRAL